MAEKELTSVECCVYWCYHNPSVTGVLQDLAHLPRWVCYLQAAAETRSTFIARKQTHSPPPFLSWRPPSANTSGFSASCASGQQGAHNRLSRSTFFKGEREVLCWPQQLVTQSPFSSSFCKLFCIFSNVTMLAVSSWQRTSTFNCTCDPRLEGAVCSVLWGSMMDVKDPRRSSRVLILYLM